MLAFTRAVLALQGRDESAPALPEWARETLRQRHAALQAEARRARRLGPEGRHELRIVLKKLRYAQEFLASVLPPRRLERSAKALADAQALLGQLNDLSTAQALLATAPAGLAAPWVERWQAALQVELASGLQALPAMERALARTPTPWD
jgi:CHAD domain-containing protein